MCICGVRIQPCNIEKIYIGCTVVYYEQIEAIAYMYMF